jgi:hypothetical protein
MNIQLRHLFEALKLIGSAFGGLAFASSIYVGIVKFSGGRIYPWLTPTETQELISTTFKALTMDFNNRFDLLMNDRYKIQCDDYKDRLNRAKMALARNSHDLVASDLQIASLQVIATIPNCRV